ncbi:MAG: hypothetical protein LBQ65_06240, partial [Tannerellaceae bacterium]|nr:hypothetical protein [Tannerellaceae bacterium]
PPPKEGEEDGSDAPATTHPHPHPHPHPQIAVMKDVDISPGLSLTVLIAPWTEVISHHYL